MNPNYLTLCALIAGLAIPFTHAHPIIAFTLLCTSGLFDILDGKVARRLNKTSPLGAIFDITSDRIIEFAIILSLFLVDPFPRALPCILMLGSVLFCVTTFLVVGIFTENDSEKSFHYSPGIIERKEAFAFFALMILFPMMFSVLAYVFTALITLTGAIRLFQFSVASKSRLT